MSNYTKGAKGERELLSLFYEEGFVGFRAPSSGSTTERELPDVLVGNGELVFAIEVKRSGGDYEYLDEYEIEDLHYFAEAFGAEPFIAVRFDYGDWFLFEDHELHQTDGGRYRIKKENVDKGKTISDIV
jgi:Holliday junction resolvase